LRNLDINSILIRCPNWVGDLVMATPALRAVRSRFPNAHITVVVKKSVKEVIQGLDLFNEIVEFDPKDKDKGWVGLIKFSKKLAHRKWDLALILPNSIGAAFMAYFAKAKRRVGFDLNHRGFLLTHPLSYPSNGDGPLPTVEGYLHLCCFLGCENISTKYQLSLLKHTEDKVKKLFKEKGLSRKEKYLLIIPGASYGSSKCWPPDYFAKVADHIEVEFGLKVVIAPGPNEEDIAFRIKENMKREPFIFVDPILSLEELKAVIKRSSLVVTNDTGPRHIAVAFERPLIVLMGPSDPRYTSVNLSHTIVLRYPTKCSPCNLKQCPGTHECMRGISPHAVIDAAHRLIYSYGL